MGQLFTKAARRTAVTIAVFLLFVPPMSAQAPPATAETEVLTLDQAVALALQNNRSVGVAALQVERSEQIVGAARARRFPSLEVQAQAGTTLTPIRISFPEGAFGTFPETGPIPGEDTVVEAPRAISGNVNATLAQPLTQLHRIGLNTKLSEISRDIDQQKLRAQRAATAASVRTLYYQILQIDGLARAKEEQVAAYRELDRVVSERVTLEAALPSDGLEVKARVANGEYELAGLRGDLATAKERMNQLLGREITHDFRPVAVTETALEDVDLARAMARALENRPDLAQSRMAIDSADTDRRLKKAESIPELSLALTYYSFINVDLLPRQIAQLGLQLKWEPFDWGRRRKERAEKALQVQQAKSQAREAEDLARIEVSQGFRKLQEARLLVEAGRLGRDAAAEKLRVVTTRHTKESALLTDVLDAQANMSAARAQYDRALLTFWTAKADFQKSLGEEQ